MWIPAGMQHKYQKVAENWPILSSLCEETSTQNLPQLIICFLTSFGQPEKPRAVVALILYKKQIYIPIYMQTGPSNHCTFYVDEKTEPIWWFSDPVPNGRASDLSWQILWALFHFSLDYYSFSFSLNLKIKLTYKVFTNFCVKKKSHRWFVLLCFYFRFCLFVCFNIPTDCYCQNVCESVTVFNPWWIYASVIKNWTDLIIVCSQMTVQALILVDHNFVHRLCHSVFEPVCSCCFILSASPAHENSAVAKEQHSLTLTHRCCPFLDELKSTFTSSQR